MNILILGSNGDLAQNEKSYEELPNFSLFDCVYAIGFFWSE